MKTLVLILLILPLMNVEAFSDRLRRPREIAHRRQFNSYSNNILHENPNYPMQDQTAQSSVKVNFNPHQTEQKIAFYNNNPPHIRSIANNINNNYRPLPTPQSQLFNVGYSVKFTNGIQPQSSVQQPKFVNPPTRILKNLEEGEIITGTRKRNEQVQDPSALEFSPQDFVSHALLESKKQKLSGIKPSKSRYTIPANYPNAKILLNQANLSPSTQKYYKILEQAKPQTQNLQDLQQRYSWRNLSPGVEIIRSTELPSVNQKFTQAANFNHNKVRSQDFDYTNALDNYNNNNHQQQQQQQFQQQPQLPVDMSLLKEPLQVQVDTRLLDEAMKSNFPAGSSNNNLYTNQQETYLQGQYRTLPVQLEERQHDTAGSFHQDYDYDQSRYQYRIYGKPQPISTLQFEQSQRTPRYTVTNLQTNLRPPPMSVYKQRGVVV